MSLYRRNPARDKEEGAIVKALQAIGRQVTPLSGAGVPDLLVIRPAHDQPIHVVETIEQALDAAMAHDLVLIEVKTKGNGLTPHQLRWHNEALNRGNQE